MELLQMTAVANVAAQSPFLQTRLSAVHLSDDNPSTSPDPIYSNFMILLFLRRQNKKEQIRAKNLSVILNTNIIHVTVNYLNTPQHCKVKFILLL
jgi:hypothetical protein